MSGGHQVAYTVLPRSRRGKGLRRRSPRVLFELALYVSAAEFTFRVVLNLDILEGSSAVLKPLPRHAHHLVNTGVTVMLMQSSILHSFLRL